MECPYCLTSFHEQWSELDIYYNHIISTSHLIRNQVCPACHKTIIELGLKKYNGKDSILTWRLVLPKNTSRMPIPKEVDDQNLISDYEEACAVFADSPKASAALSRRCLQHILREKAKIHKKDLSLEIQAVIDSNTLPSALAENLDYVRAVGNFGTHPIKSQNSGEIVDVEPGEAEWNLTLVEELMDFYYVKPALAKKKREELNIKLKQAGKPELPV